MRDSIVSYFNFENQVEKAVRGLYQADVMVLRSNVIDSSNLHADNLSTFSLRGAKLDDLIRLALFSWYVPEEVGFVLRADLVQKGKQLSLLDRTLISQFLKSKAYCLLFLQETQLWHSRDLFGNLLSKKFQLSRFLKLTPLKRKIAKVQRKRGYDDKGSKVPEHRWLPTSDWSLTKLQNEIENQRQSFKDTNAFIEGFLW